MVKASIIFKTGRNYRYELMCDIDVYDIYHVPISDGACSCVEIPFPILSSKVELISLGHAINFIDNWFQ